MGVASGYQSNAQEEAAVEDGYLYPFGVYEKNKKNFEKEIGLPNVQLYDLQNADQEEQDSVKAALKKYKRLFNSIFHNYANCLTNPSTTLDFDALGDIYRNLHVSEYYKFLKDYNMGKYITLDEITALNRLYHTKV